MGIPDGKSRWEIMMGNQDPGWEIIIGNHDPKFLFHKRSEILGHGYFPHACLKNQDGESGPGTVPIFTRAFSTN